MTGRLLMAGWVTVAVLGLLLVGLYAVPHLALWGLFGLAKLFGL